MVGPSQHSDRVNKISHRVFPFPFFHEIRISMMLEETSDGPQRIIWPDYSVAAIQSAAPMSSPQPQYIPVPKPIPTSVALLFYPYLLRFYIKFRCSPSISQWQILLRQHLKDQHLIVVSMHPGSCILLVHTASDLYDFLENLSEFARTEEAQSLHFGGFRALQESDLPALECPELLSTTSWLSPSFLRCIPLLRPQRQVHVMPQTSPLQMPSHTMVNASPQAATIALLPSMLPAMEFRSERVSLAELQSNRNPDPATLRQEILRERRRLFESYLATRGILSRYQDNNWDRDWQEVEQIFAEKYPDRPWFKATRA